MPRGVPWLVVLPVLVCTLGAATAVLDCIGDTAWGRRSDESELALDAPRKVVALQFRSTSLKGWRATGATLMVHVARGSCAADCQLLAGYTAAALVVEKKEQTRPSLRVSCVEAGAGWWRIELPAAIAQRLADEPDGAILLASPARRGGPVLHSRETLAFAPRLIVEGAAQ